MPGRGSPGCSGRPAAATLGSMPPRSLAVRAAACAAALAALALAAASPGGAARSADPTPLDGLVVKVQTTLVGPGEPLWTACPATAQGFTGEDAPSAVTALAGPAGGLKPSASALISQTYASGKLVGFTLILAGRLTDGSTAYVHVFREHPERGCLALPETGQSPAGATYDFDWTLDACNGCSGKELAHGTGCLAAHPLGSDGATILKPSRPRYQGKKQYGLVDVYSFGGCAPATLPAVQNPASVVKLTGSVAGTGTLRSDIAAGTLAPDLSPFACTARCTFPFASGATVTFTAQPAPGWKVSGWSGLCRGRRATCTVVARAAGAVNVTFARVA